jgi:receptor expression-enhancing protein 5/6
MAVQLEQKVGVPKALVVVGVSAVVSVLIFFNIMGNLLTNIIGFVYPAYASFKVIIGNRQSRVPTKMTTFSG